VAQVGEHLPSKAVQTPVPPKRKKERKKKLRKKRKGKGKQQQGGGWSLGGVCAGRAHQKFQELARSRPLIWVLTLPTAGGKKEMWPGSWLCTWDRNQSVPRESRTLPLETLVSQDSSCNVIDDVRNNVLPCPRVTRNRATPTGLSCNTDTRSIKSSINSGATHRASRASRQSVHLLLPSGTCGGLEAFDTEALTRKNPQPTCLPSLGGLKHPDISRHDMTHLPSWFLPAPLQIPGPCRASQHTLALALGTSWPEYARCPSTAPAPQRSTLVSLRLASKPRIAKMAS
jgi:hypothetical protein